MVVIRRLSTRLSDPEVRRWIARTSAIVLFVVVAGLVVRSTGEASRTGRTVDGQSTQLEKEIRADCPFKRRVAELPKLTPYPAQTLVDLATAAREAYEKKGCEQAGFGPVPPLFTARPSPPARP